MMRYSDSMHDRNTLRVHAHHIDFGYVAIISTVADGNIRRLYQTPVHLDEKSLVGWVKDFKRELKNARCLWCGDPLQYVTEIDDLDVWGFCSTDCQTEAMREAKETR